MENIANFIHSHRYCTVLFLVFIVVVVVVVVVPIDGYYSSQILKRKRELDGKGRRR